MYWYYQEGFRQVGPVTEDEFRSLVEKGAIRTDTLVWNDSLANWQPFGELSGRRQDIPAPGTVCSVCRRSFPADQVVRFRDSWICFECKPAYFQQLREGAALPGIMNYAGFWPRFLAKLIDGLIIWFVDMGLLLGAGMVLGMAGQADILQGSDDQAALLMLLVYPLLFGISIGYSVWFLGKYGATPGKMALGLIIVTSDGERISYMKAFIRFFAEMLSAIACYIGYLMVAFDEERKALHDILCDTRVVRKTR